MIVTTVCGIKIKLTEAPLIPGEPYAFNVPGEDEWYLEEQYPNHPIAPGINRKSFTIIW